MIIGNEYIRRTIQPTQEECDRTKGQLIEYVIISEEEWKRDFDVAMRMIENGQTTFIIDANPKKSEERT